MRAAPAWELPLQVQIDTQMAPPVKRCAWSDAPGPVRTASQA